MDLLHRLLVSPWRGSGTSFRGTLTSRQNVKRSDGNGNSIDDDFLAKLQSLIEAIQQDVLQELPGKSLLEIGGHQDLFTVCSGSHCSAI